MAPNCPATNGQSEEYQARLKALLEEEQPEVLVEEGLLNL